MPHRDKCYAQIKRVMAESLKRYYTAHPDRLDERGLDAIEASKQGLTAIFDVLEEYEIKKRKVERS